LCVNKKSHKEFCKCLKPHSYHYKNGKDILSLKIGEELSKEFEKNLRSILSSTSLLQHKVTLNYRKKPSEFAPIRERLENSKSCNLGQLKKRLEGCGDNTLYSNLIKSGSELSLDKLISKYDDEINNRESNYMAVEGESCKNNYRCNYKASCSLSDLESESFNLDYKTIKVQSFFKEIEEELAQSSNVSDALGLALKRKREEKDLEGYRSLSKIYNEVKDSYYFRGILDLSVDHILSIAQDEDGISSFYQGKNEISRTLDSVLSKCKETYQKFEDVMCQSTEKIVYDFSDVPLQGLANSYNSSKDDFSGSYATCDVGSKKITSDLEGFRDFLNTDEVIFESAEKMSINQLESKANKVRSLICEEIPSSGKKLKKQIKEVRNKIKQACPNESSLISESCAYLKSYKKMLESKEQTKEFVKKNNSFKDYLKAHPSSPIKTEEEYIAKIGVPSVAKSLLLGGEDENSEPEVQKTIAKPQEKVKENDTQKSDNVTDTKQASNKSNNTYTFKRAPASIDKTKSKSNSSNYISPPAGLTFKYKEPSAKKISKDIEELRKKVAKEKKRQEDLLKSYNSASQEEQNRIDSQFDLIDSSFNTSPSGLSSDEVDRFIENERLIDSGLKSPDKVRSIASSDLSNFITSPADPYRETINNDMLTKDRIDLVDQSVGSSEKISAFDIELGPNGYEIQKLIVSGSIEKDLSLVYDRDPKKSIVDKISRSSANQSEQVQKYKKLLQSKKDFLISKNSELDIEVIVRYNFNLQKHEVTPFVGNLNDEFYLKNRVEFKQLQDQVQKSIDEGDFRTLSQI